MPLMMVPVLLGADPAYVETFASREQAVKVLSREVRTGTLFFSKGSCLAVKVFAKGRYTHVGAVVMRNGKPYVYHACKINGVCSQPLQDYLRFLDEDVVHVFHPRKRWSLYRQRRFHNFLKSKIGTPYAVKHFLWGRRSSKGMHCSEYMTDALIAADLMEAERPAKVSPASLAEGVVDGALYRAVKTVAVSKPPREKSDSRCGQLWIDTKDTSKKCWKKMKGWFCFG